MPTALPPVNALSQSLLLSGGSLDDARTLCRAILGSSHHKKIDKDIHPDLHFYAPEGKAHLHTMASMQKMVREMSLPPFEAKAKVFIISEAEKMLPSSSNALLKTLEEPIDNSYFLLLTDQPELLLPTILSRLQPLSFPRSEIVPVDMSPYLALAQKGEWDALLEALPALEEENPDAVLHGLLSAIQDPKAIDDAKTALAHNLKPQTIYFTALLRSQHGRTCNLNSSIKH
jgi:DNA polymerase III delta prime subunit